jgi:hypothetical protein
LAVTRFRTEGSESWSATVIVVLRSVMPNSSPRSSSLRAIAHGRVKPRHGKGRAA